jgi:hypothetical protein
MTLCMLRYHLEAVLVAWAADIFIYFHVVTRVECVVKIPSDVESFVCVASSLRRTKVLFPQTHRPRECILFTMP